MRDHALYLKDILAAIDRIEEFVTGMDLEAFQADDKTSSAVLRKFEIIGEAAKQIPDEMSQQSSGGSLEGSVRDARQADPFLFWS